MLVMQLVPLVLSVLFYIWYGVMMAKLFKQLGVEGWKGWVPVIGELEMLKLVNRPPIQIVFIMFIPIYGLLITYQLLQDMSKLCGKDEKLALLGLIIRPLWAGKMLDGAKAGGSTMSAAATEALYGPPASAQPASFPPGAAFGAPGMYDPYAAQAAAQPAAQTAAWGAAADPAWGAAAWSNPADPAQAPQPAAAQFAGAFAASPYAMPTGADPNQALAFGAQPGYPGQPSAVQPQLGAYAADPFAMGQPSPEQAYPPPSPDPYAQNPHAAQSPYASPEAFAPGSAGAQPQAAAYPGAGADPFALAQAQAPGYPAADPFAAAQAQAAGYPGAADPFAAAQAQAAGYPGAADPFAAAQAQAPGYPGAADPFAAAQAQAGYPAAADPFAAAQAQAAGYPGASPEAFAAAQQPSPAADPFAMAGLASAQPQVTPYPGPPAQPFALGALAAAPAVQPTVYPPPSPEPVQAPVMAPPVMLSGTPAPTQASPPVMPPPLQVAQQPAAAAEPVAEYTVLVDRAASQQWSLVLDDGRRFDLWAPSVILGRAPAAAGPGTQVLAISDETCTISKAHARLDLVDGAWQVTDAGSTNGIIVTRAGRAYTVPSGTTAAVGGEQLVLGSVGMRVVPGEKLPQSA